MTIRAFIAIEINKEIKNKISEFLTQLKKTDADVKWVTCENIHLTLKFIGYIEEDILPSLSKIVNDSVSCLRPFDINIENVGAFPSIKRPRVLYVCAQDKGGNLLKIYEKLDKGVKVLGIMRDSKKYVGHITLGRIKSQKNISALRNALSSGAGYFFGQERVDYISLMQSKLTPKGPIYKRLQDFKIG